MNKLPFKPMYIKINKDEFFLKEVFPDISRAELMAGNKALDQAHRMLNLPEPVKKIIGNDKWPTKHFNSSLQQYVHAFIITCRYLENSYNRPLHTSEREEVAAMAVIQPVRKGWGQPYWDGIVNPIDYKDWIGYTLDDLEIGMGLSKHDDDDNEDDYV